METFTEPKKLVKNPHFPDQRQKNSERLGDVAIDTPIIGLINSFNKLPFCFTMQSCVGHFLYKGQDNPSNLDPLPDLKTICKVEYRIAYIAFCIENSDGGRRLLKTLMKIPAIDPENIQFGCAKWFWRRQVNSYALQVEPDRFKDRDKAILDYREALYIERVRNLFFVQLKREITNQVRRVPSYPPVRY